MITQEILEHIDALEKSISSFYDGIQNGVLKNVDTQNKAIEEIEKGFAELRAEFDSLAKKEEEQNARISQDRQNIESLAEKQNETRRQLEKQLSDLKASLDVVIDQQTSATQQLSSISRQLESLKSKVKEKESSEKKSPQFTMAPSGVNDALVNRTRVVSFVALGLSLLLLAGIAFGLLYKGKEYRDVVKYVKAEIEATPAPTQIPSTPTPMVTARVVESVTPSADPTQTPTPTPDPAEAIPEVFPFLSKAEFIDSERLEVEGAECLRSYQMGDSLYANVFYGEGLDENLFATLCASYNKLVIQATPEPTPETTPDPTSDSTGTEAPAVPTATPDSTPGTTPGDESSTGEDNGNDTSKEDVELITTVLAAIRGEGNYLCVFFVKQKEAGSIRYDQTLSYINTALGVSPDEIASYLTVFPQDDELIGRYATEKTLYPIQVSLVTEEVAQSYDSFIEENGYRAVWLCDFSCDKFVLYIFDSGETDAAGFETKMKEAKDLFDPSLVYIGAKDDCKYALIFTMVDENDPWYKNITEAYKLNQVR